MPRRVARTVLRGDRRGNPPVLPGKRAGAADRDGDQLTDDLRCHRRLAHLDELQSKARAVNRRLLDTERVGQGCVLASPAFERIAQPTLAEDGRRAPALRFGDPRVQALAGALCTTMLAVTGITNKSLRALMTGLLTASTTAQTKPATTWRGCGSTGSSAASRAATAIGSPTTGCGSRSSTPRSMTGSFDPARPRPTANSTTDTKSITHHRHSHHRNHRPGSPTAKGGLKTQDNCQRPNDKGSLGTWCGACVAPGAKYMKNCLSGVSAFCWRTQVIARSARSSVSV